MPDKKPKPIILQVIPEMETGGAEKTALDIGDTIVAQGWTSFVASAGGRMLDQLAAGGSQHITLPLASKNPITIWRNAGRLAAVIREENVSLIHARSRSPAWSALIAAKRTGIPFVTTYHGAYSQQNFVKAWYNSVMARADVIIANSQWTADLVLSRKPGAKDRIEVVHRGTDFGAFRKQAISKQRLSALKSKWGLNEDDFVVVQLGRLTKGKGQQVVIDAAAELTKEFPNLRFVLAGDAQGRSEYLQSLKDQIDRLELVDTVILPGHCDDPAAAMALADVVTVASIYAETFGRAAVEACALERPVVVTRNGAVGETVQAEPEVSKADRTGWKVPPGDPHELAVVLREILSMTPAERDKTGRRARTYCENRFSLKQMCDQTIAIYKRLLT